MQTFLPYPDFAASAAVLDSPRLGKQRVETLQILRALVLPDYGWRNHPAVIMWRGRVPALVGYGLTCVAEWTRRGFADSTAAQIAEFAPQTAELTQDELAAADLLPSWLGNPALHTSHRSRLVAKDRGFYQELFPGVDEEVEYLWPGADQLPATAAPDHPTGSSPVWVVRPESAAALGGALAVGAVGVGAGPGLEQDLTGLDLPALREMVEPALRRRSARPLAALVALVAEMRRAEEVAVPIENGRRLLLGEIVGDYSFDAGAENGLRHSRPVRWERVILRSSIVPPAALQDVRPLFRVRRTHD